MFHTKLNVHLYSKCFETVISFKYRNQNTRAPLFEIKVPKNQMQTTSTSRDIARGRGYCNIEVFNFLLRLGFLIS